jgi:hypothetical protein
LLGIVAQIAVSADAVLAQQPDHCLSIVAEAIM